MHKMKTEIEKKLSIEVELLLHKAVTQIKQENKNASLENKDLHNFAEEGFKSIRASMHKLTQEVQ